MMEKESLEQAHKFQVWKQNLQKNGASLLGVQPVYLKYRHNGEILFALLEADVSVPEGGKIPPVCFLKGSAVSVLICMRDNRTQERFLLLVRQRRICNGALIYEHAAGMIDKNDAPLDVAVREVEEETGLKVLPHQVVPLHVEPLYPSTGTCDESMFLFFCELEMEREDIFRFDKVATGVASEHEQIETAIVTIPEALRLITNTNGLLNIYLYLQHKQDFSPLVQ
jgi:8-oxo-dGTP pyrophosphatase MutT (NUDIX family)